MSISTPPPAWPEPGLYPNIPEHVYHPSPGVSVSRLKRFAAAAAKAFVAVEETNAMRLGTLLHTVVLQPETVGEKYHLTDLKRINDREKATRAEIERAAGRELLKRADYEHALRVRDALFKNRVLREVFEHPDGIVTEQSFAHIDEETGLLRRGRSDIFAPGLGLIADLKRTQDASEYAIQQAISRLKYHWQADSYQCGYEALLGARPDFLFFFVEADDPPYLVHPAEVDADSMDAASVQVRAALRAYAECLKTGIWPGYTDGITTIRITERAMNERLL